MNGASDWETFLSERLDKIRQGGLFRNPPPLKGIQGRLVHRPEGQVLNFSSNDYLGLAAHPAVVEAARLELERGAAGAGSSRLVSGTFEAHQKLEATVASFKGCEAAVSFSSGYAAATGCIPAVCGPGDVVLLDKLSHACLVDAARLSGATIRVFPHNDLTALERRLEWASTRHPRGRILIVAESVYSMDGDCCPLGEIVALKERFGAWLFLDEAHALGVVGPRGMGLAADCGLTERVEIQMGTLGKAAGAHGATIAGNRLLRDLLINSARSLIFSTAPPPHVAAAATKGLEIIASTEGERLRLQLRARISEFSQRINPITAIPAAERGTRFEIAGFGIEKTERHIPIFPVVLGCEKRTMDASTRLLTDGLWVPAIRFPSVARGSARLRVTLTAAHTQDDVIRLAEALQRLDEASGERDVENLADNPSR